MKRFHEFQYILVDNQSGLVMAGFEFCHDVSQYLFAMKESVTIYRNTGIQFHNPRNKRTPKMVKVLSTDDAFGEDYQTMTRYQIADAITDKCNELLSQRPKLA